MGLRKVFEWTCKGCGNKCIKTGSRCPECNTSRGLSSSRKLMSQRACERRKEAKKTKIENSYMYYI